jgi:hypothetical protein
MKCKANGCWPFVVIAGFLALGTAPAGACDTARCDKIVLAENSDPQAATAAGSTATRHGRRGRHHAHHSSRSHSEKRVAAKSSASDKAAADRKTTKSADGDLSPAVANAKAQMGTTGDDATPSPATAAINGAPAAAPDSDASPAPIALSDDAPAADGSFVVAADQLNDLDRAAEADKPGPRILRPVPTTPHFSNANSEDTWSQTSMIGKVFIMFGGFLTLASAARMFLA